MTRPGLYQRLAASCILWARIVNLVEKERDSVPASFDMFITDILLLIAHIYHHIWEVPIFPLSVLVYIYGSVEIFAISFFLWNHLPPSLFQFLSHYLNSSFFLSLLSLNMLVWGQCSNVHPWHLSNQAFPHRILNHTLNSSCMKANSSFYSSIFLEQFNCLIVKSLISATI